MIGAILRSINRAGFCVAVLAGIVMSTTLTGSRAYAADASARIAGGADATGRRYVWTITNTHSVPIVKVEFPHYRATWSSVPDGWSSELVDGRGGNGVFLAEAADSSGGIAPTQSAEFQLGATDVRAVRGRRDVAITFSDGTRIKVEAEVPVRESVGERSVSLIGLGVIFGVFLLIRLRKAGRRKPPAPP